MKTPKHEKCLQILLLIFLVLFPITTITSAKEEDGFLTPKAHVSIVNELRSDLALTTHCRSKNDDLGIQVIPYGGNFSFHFRPAFWGNTLFACDMEWRYSGPKHLDFYKDPRDHHKCNCYHYYWSIKPEDSCMFNFITNKYDFVILGTSIFEFV